MYVRNALLYISAANSFVRRLAVQILFTIAQPDVYKSKTGDGYVVFGDYKIDDMSSQTGVQQQYANQLSQAQSQSANDDEDDIPELEEAGEDDVDEDGLEAKDIEMVVTQANVSRAKAIKALRENDGDMVNAIMVCGACVVPCTALEPGGHDDLCEML